MSFAVININGNKPFQLGNDVFGLLLSDKTTKKNIIWATNDYEALGEKYHPKAPITIQSVTGEYAGLIQPRVSKARLDQITRTKEKAEVFTPAWICNEQNNLIDRSWFGRDPVFNTPQNKKWKTNRKRISFQEKKGAGWQDYVDAKRIEITCGEAPYLTSRYDMSSGAFIKVHDRIGLLDRKLRVVNENTTSFDEWVRWALRALESIYGFEFQGDSLLIARENILAAFIETMQYQFDQEPGDKLLKKAANIISWNIWQMDGLTNTVPYGLTAGQYRQTPPDPCKSPKEEEGYCKIHDWRSKKTLFFHSLTEKKGR